MIPRMLFGLGLLIRLQLDYKSGRSISACIPGPLNCYLCTKHNPGSRATVWNIFQTGVWGYKKYFCFARNMTSWVQLLREVTSYDVIALEMWVPNLKRGTKYIYAFLKLGYKTFLTAKKNLSDRVCTDWNENAPSDFSSKSANLTFVNLAKVSVENEPEWFEFS